MLDTKLSIYTLSGRILDIHPISLEITYVRNKSAGMLIFSYEHLKIPISNGNNVEFSIQKHFLFDGYIFSISENNGIFTVTCFDKIRYFLFKDSRVYNNIYISNAIKGLLQEKGIEKYNVDDPLLHIQQNIFRNTTYLQMINTWIKYIKDNTGEDYTLFCNGEYVSFKNKKNCTIDIVLQCDSNIINYKFIRDINTDTYNYFKIVRENKKRGINDVFIKENKEHQKKYGTLQYFEKVSDKVTIGEIMNMLEILYNQKCLMKTYLHLKVLGSEKFFIGAVVKVIIQKADVDRLFIIEELKHIIRDNVYFCDMKLRLI